MLGVMSSANRSPGAVGGDTETPGRLVLCGVVFALVFPTLLTWVYFVFAERYAAGAQQSIYLIGKGIQFAFPAMWVWLVLREPLSTGRPSLKGLLIGAAFSVVVVGAGWLLFDGLLREIPVFSTAAKLIREKIGEFGIDSLWKYSLLAGFYSLLHSLLEEYYWRWFAFRQLRRLVRLWPAIVISALAFMGHHVIVLSEFFEQTRWLAWLLAAAVAVGGAFWAWLYERTGSLFGPWLSHLLIDAGVFWVGYVLVRETMVR
jgi:membrane protease YdiL (CAAX protease family)